MHASSVYCVYGYGAHHIIKMVNNTKTSRKTQYKLHTDEIKYIYYSAQRVIHNQTPSAWHHFFVFFLFGVRQTLRIVVDRILTRTAIYILHVYFSHFCFSSNLELESIAKRMCRTRYHVVFE